ncbi:hypothetical protein EYF80_053607 [Liparis tanakae]|uniref:Uncharacterized protein n=1 Tax=Liparis tanakae TaxID=230148 RepID=A0A4Z2F5X0_9TELE|nr:hypothetical protein EYF80_053607 [Liparis tanakae]
MNEVVRQPLEVTGAVGAPEPSSEYHLENEDGMERPSELLQTVTLQLHLSVRFKTQMTKRFGLEGEGHLVHQRFDSFSISGAQRVSLWEEEEDEEEEDEEDEEGEVGEEEDPRWSSYVGGAEAAVRSRRADDPVKKPWISTRSERRAGDLQEPLTCRKWASTMFMYMSSSSRPLPMKHRCSPLAMEPDSNDCFWASSRDFTERENSDGPSGVSSHQVGVQVEGRGQVAGVVLLRRPTVHHEEPHAVLRVKTSVRK